MNRVGEGAAASLVDTHLHLWDTGYLDYPWLEGHAELGRPHRVAEAAEVVPAHRSVMVQADCRPEQGLAEVEWVLAQRTEGRTLGLDVAAIVAWAPVDGPGLERHLDALAERELVTGVRRILQAEPVGVVRSESMLQGVTRLGERGLTFDVTVRQDQLAEVIELVARCPGTTFVLDHLGNPSLVDPALRPGWERALAQLAALPNVVLKISGLGARSVPDQALAAQAGGFVRRALEMFGAERSMIGSDWPVSSLGSAPGRSWVEWVDLVCEQAGAAASAAELSALRSGTAERVYRLVAG